MVIPQPMSGFGANSNSSNKEDNIVAESGQSRKRNQAATQSESFRAKKITKRNSSSTADNVIVKTGQSKKRNELATPSKSAKAKKKKKNNKSPTKKGMVSPLENKNLMPKCQHDNPLCYSVEENKEFFCDKYYDSHPYACSSCAGCKKKLGSEECKITLKKTVMLCKNAKSGSYMCNHGYCWDCFIAFQHEAEQKNGSGRGTRSIRGGTTRRKWK